MDTRSSSPLIPRRDFLASAFVAGSATAWGYGRPQFMAQTAPAERLAPLTMLCLDPRDFAGAEGFDHRVSCARKDPDRPVFEPAPNQFDSQRVLNHGTVLYDGGRFRMWYGGMGAADKAKPWWEWLRACYAESDDGLHWRRMPVNSDGSHVIPVLPHNCCIYKDEAAPDANRKYVSLYFYNSGEQRELAEQRKHDPVRPVIPGRLLTSAEGLHWRHEPAQVTFEGPKPWSFVPQSIFRDVYEADPARRWKAYGFSSINQRSRAGFCVYSADARHWIAPAVNPILNPVDRGAPADSPGPEQHIHDTVVWQQAGYYLALYQYLYGKEQDDVELAVSRDGHKFTFVDPGVKVIARGGAGAWDRGEIVQTPPVVVGDEIWLYYGGSDYYHPSDGPYDRARSDRLRVCAGLARLQRDRYAYLQPKLGVVDRSLQTSAVTLPKGTWRLFINADCSLHDSLTVEILQKSGDVPLPNYGAANCRPLTRDELRQTVQWSERDALDSANLGAVKLRIHFKGRPKLYGYTWKPA